MAGPILNTRQLAERWGCGEQTLVNQRYRGAGPRWIKLGRLVRYRLADIEAYEESQAQGGAAA
ncbi:helix-turn-helix transcriptional regulator [Nocardiopsis sp. CA-288880]|uniref:helix-turn-helix transcriptional regulator n=1 Tax=Nocardiopsis sp. CA-288880 TaxID=3239995 RepID=UPI003D99FBE6